MDRPTNRTPRPRGRPSSDNGAVVTRDRIIHRALDIAGAEGFPAVTMQRLARDLDVTAKALYNHVDNRQDVIDAAAALLMQQMPSSTLDPENWTHSLRNAYQRARSTYRRFPRAILIFLDETLTPTDIDPKRVTLAEDMLRFFVDIGLTLPQAVAARESFLIDVFGFALTVDYMYDRSDHKTQEAIVQPVPAAWLDALPDTRAPLCRQAAELPASTSDRMFEAIVNLRIAAIKALKGK